MHSHLPNPGRLATSTLLALALALALAPALGACAGAGAPAGDDDGVVDAAPVDEPVPLPALPLRTQGRWIVDAGGARFKMAAVTWYGADQLDYVVAGLDRQPLRALAEKIRDLGFNTVRLPFSNELVSLDPIIAESAVRANPELTGRHALEVLDAVIAALAHEGLVVILDNHVSTAGWCCSDNDGNGLWYTAGYPESTWLAHWTSLAERYRDQPAVVGVDLRNELRPANGIAPTWGDGTAHDWHAAATRGGNAVLAANPDLLIIVQGLNYSADLGGPYTLPVELARANRVVYSPHDYAWFHGDLASTAELHTALGNAWGYLLAQNQPYTAPVLVGEFGTCNDDPACLDGSSGAGLWYRGFREYLAAADIDWVYWAFNGTQARAPGRTFGAVDNYGVLDETWTAPASGAHLAALKALQPATQSP